MQKPLAPEAIRQLSAHEYPRCSSAPLSHLLPDYRDIFCLSRGAAYARVPYCQRRECTEPRGVAALMRRYGYRRDVWGETTLSRGR